MPWKLYVNSHDVDAFVSHELWDGVNALCTAVSIKKEKETDISEAELMSFVLVYFDNRESANDKRGSKLSLSFHLPHSHSLEAEKKIIHRRWIFLGNYRRIILKERRLVSTESQKYCRQSPDALFVQLMSLRDLQKQKIKAITLRERKKCLSSGWDEDRKRSDEWSAFSYEIPSQQRFFINDSTNVSFGLRSQRPLLIIIVMILSI